MKKLFFALIIMGLSWSTINAQDVYDDYMTPPKENISKAERKAQKEKEKRLKAATDSADYKLACAALRQKQFALTATRVDLGNMGYSEYGLSENTNFVYQVGNEGVAQIALNTGELGLNGFGGVTCKGLINGEHYSEDKKGNVSYDFTINGNGVTVQVNVYLYAGSKNAYARVEPVFGGSWSAITLHGELVPYNKGE